MVTVYPEPDVNAAVGTKSADRTCPVRQLTVLPARSGSDQQATVLIGTCVRGALFGEKTTLSSEMPSTAASKLMAAWLMLCVNDVMLAVGATRSLARTVRVPCLNCRKLPASSNANRRTPNTPGALPHGRRRSFPFKSLERAPGSVARRTPRATAEPFSN